MSETICFCINSRRFLTGRKAPLIGCGKLGKLENNGPGQLGVIDSAPRLPEAKSLAPWREKLTLSYQMSKINMFIIDGNVVFSKVVLEIADSRNDTLD